MGRSTRLAGCTCRTLRSLHTSASASYTSAQASTSRSTAEPEGQHDPYNAFVSLAPTPENNGSTDKQGSLAVLRISVKDNFATSDGASFTTCGSQILSTYRSPFDATVVKLLKDNGARLVGKTNMDEFGMGSHGIYSMHGAVKNPLDPSRVAGGSSSGAAASVAAGYCEVAIGSDTGGSVRLPASYTGTLGFKPSYGLLSRYGLVAYASSLDTVGLISRRAKSISRVFEALNRHDSKDPTSIQEKHRLRSKTPRKELQSLRIGIPIECFPAELAADSIKPLRLAIARLKGSIPNVQIASVSIPSITRTLSAYYTIATAEASSNLARYDGIRYGTRSETDITETRSNAFGEEVKKRIILGTYALTADAFDNYFLAAQKLRETLKAEMNAIFAVPNPLLQGNGTSTTDSECGVDVLLFPSAISGAPTFEEARKSSQGVGGYVQDVLTVPASLAGLPAASCPVPHAEGELPVGVQVVGQWGCDELVLAVAEALEEDSQS